MTPEVFKTLPFTRDYWEFIYIATKSFPLHFPLIILASMRKKADVIVCEMGDKVIGGFVITDLPLNIFRLKNIFSAKKIGVFKNMAKDGYRYLTYVVIDKKYRKSGFGREMLIQARAKYGIKSYFTPFTAELQGFYEKAGATIYKTKDGKTLEGLKSPVMAFE